MERPEFLAAARDRTFDVVAAMRQRMAEQRAAQEAAELLQKQRKEAHESLHKQLVRIFDVNPHLVNKARNTEYIQLANAEDGLVIIDARIMEGSEEKEYMVYWLDRYYEPIVHEDGYDRTIRVRPQSATSLTRTTHAGTDFRDWYRSPIIRGVPLEVNQVEPLLEALEP